MKDTVDQVFQPDESAALVVLEFPSFRDFIGAYSPIISEEGIFIRDEDVSKSNAFSVGDQIDFEVRLKDDFRLIQGKGQVIRLGAEEAAGGATGAAVRFQEIDEPSQRLVSRLVDNYVRDGGTLFDIGGSAPVGGVSEPEAAVEAGQEEPASTKPGDQDLTAETLQASEAAELFSGEDESDDHALEEVETVSPDDAWRTTEEPAAPAPAAGDEAFDPNLPAGAETIAIPAGLVSVEDARKAMEEMAAADEPAVEVGPAEPSDDLLSVEPAALDGDLEEGAAPPPLELPTLDDGEIAPTDEEAPDGLAPEAGPGEPAPSDVVEESFGEITPVDAEPPPEDESGFEAAADSLEDELGARVGIPDEIAQVAEELSGVHRFDPPETDEQSGGIYAGAASARSEANVGGRIAAIVVVAVLLGAAAFYFDFGKTVVGWLGLDDGGIESVAVDPGETMARVPDPAPVAGAEVRDQTEGTEAASGASGEPGEQEQSVSVPAEDSPVESPMESEPEPAPEATVEATVEATGETAGSSEPAEPEPASAESSGRRVEEILWRSVGETTVVTIRLNTRVSDSYFSVERIRQGAPREVFKILGVDTPYTPGEVTVGGAHVERLRTGLHPSPSGSSLHIVADLTSAAVTVRSVETVGRNLRITFS